MWTRSEFRRDVGKDEQLAVVHLLCKPFRTLVGEVAAIQLFVNDEVQWFYSLRHTAVVVFHIVLLCLEHTGFDALLGEVFD